MFADPPGIRDFQQSTRLPVLKFWLTYSEYYKYLNFPKNFLNLFFRVLTFLLRAIFDPDCQQWFEVGNVTYPWKISLLFWQTFVLCCTVCRTRSYISVYLCVFCLLLRFISSGFLHMWQCFVSHNLRDLIIRSLQKKSHRAAMWLNQDLNPISFSFQNLST